VLRCCVGSLFVVNDNGTETGVSLLPRDRFVAISSRQIDDINGRL
jgi:hypothetical protein